MNVPMNDNERQRHSRSYLLPVEDLEFLLRDELRGIRFALEYSKAELLLREWGIRSTVIVFGSAPHAVAGTRGRDARGSQDAGGTGAGEAAGRPRPILHEQARAFGRLVSERGGALGDNGGARDNVIATGGGPGIMEAANRGAREAGAPTIGFNITPADGAGARTPTSTPDLTFRFHYFAIRKMHLAMRANALAVFPGGFGTLDELFEILTLIQTRQGAARAGRAVRPRLLAQGDQLRHPGRARGDQPRTTSSSSTSSIPPGGGLGDHAAPRASRPTRRPTTPSANRGVDGA
mgnify:CR=1 FL=1